jgi:hypothetical protein
VSHPKAHPEGNDDGGDRQNDLEGGHGLSFIRCRMIA